MHTCVFDPFHVIGITIIAGFTVNYSNIIAKNYYNYQIFFFNKKEITR